MGDEFFALHVNSVTIDETGNSISIDITGTHVTKMKLWDCGGQTDSSTIDLSEVTSDSQGRYIFEITAAQAGVTSFNGLFFMEFISKNDHQEENCCGEKSNILPAVAGNFAPYHECLLNRVLAIDFEGCGKKDSSCSECSEEVYYISALLNSLYSAVRFQRFNEACQIIEHLNSFCDMCDICPPYYNENLAENSDFFSPVYEMIEEDPDCIDNETPSCQNNINIGAGYGVGTINNLIMVV